ncbi:MULTISPECIES: hypothetical protein [unclassified Microcoleus]|uniref:hypothetical protein n=1 Tax=unclassified Microcoleus TaxID=2642155 RepID=UPI002FD25D02
MSIEERRGIESIDVNQNLLLVRAPIESVAQKLSRARRADVWERDIYDREIEMTAESYIIFQFRGHPWTIVEKLTYRPGSLVFGEGDAITLSNFLSTRAIYYKCSDTCGYIGYNCYDGGAFAEMLYFEEEISFLFVSDFRELKAEDIDSAFRFTDAFMREQDIYIPNAHYENVKVGDRVNLRPKGPTLDDLVRSDFERVDYIGIS